VFVVENKINALTDIQGKII